VYSDGQVWLPPPHSPKHVERIEAYGERDAGIVGREMVRVPRIETIVLVSIGLAGL
jgi:hypothetical protein